MRRIEAHLSANRQTLWDAALGGLEVREADPGRRLVWETTDGLVSMEIVPTNEGGTRVRIEHPGGVLAGWRLRLWLYRITRHPWSASHWLALVAAGLTATAGAASLAERAPAAVAEPPEPLGPVTATLPPGPVAKGRRRGDLIGFDGIVPYGVLPRTAHSVSFEPGGVTVRMGEVQPRSPIAITRVGPIRFTETGLSKVEDRYRAPNPIDIPEHGGPAVDPTGRWVAYAPVSLDGRLFLMEVGGPRLVHVFTGIEGAHDPALTLRGDDLWLAFTREAEAYVLDLGELDRPGPSHLRMQIWRGSEVHDVGVDYPLSPQLRGWAGPAAALLGSDLSFEDIDLLGGMALTAPPGEHVVVEEGDWGRVIDTPLPDSTQYAKVRTWVSRDAHSVDRYWMIDQDGIIIKSIEVEDGVVTVRNLTEQTSTVVEID